MDEQNKHKEIDDMLNRIIKEDQKPSYFYSFQEIFYMRLNRLEISKHQATKILDIETKSLDAILMGDSKKIDFITIVKLSDFLEISPEEIINKYFNFIYQTHTESIKKAKVRSYIVNNFNLPSLKKMGLINSINDFEEIENRINTFLGYETIFDHDKNKVGAIFSSGKRKTNKENLSTWLAASRQSLEKTLNPHEFDRAKLIEYIPKIRWHSLDVDNGLYLVAQSLFKLGITVIIVPKYFSDIHIRAATIFSNEKPCIVLTKYTEFYGTLWFALMHEIFHILYDYDLIEKLKYHLTGENQTVGINENEADNFSRQYLFPDDKMNIIKGHINEPKFINYYAEQNFIHPAIIYTFYCWDTKLDEDYEKFYKNKTPILDNLLEKFSFNEFLNLSPIHQVTKKRNTTLFNT